MDTGGREWDFFVSYAGSDVRWATWIAWQLEAAGYSVLIQEWDFVPGTNWIDRMHVATQGAAHTIAVLSPDYLASAYARAEWQAAWAADPDGGDRRLLTVRVAECGRPGLLSGVTGIDVDGVSEEVAAARLERLVASVSAGRVKPAERPAFPETAPSVIDDPRMQRDLPRVWNVPAKNPNFTGRTESLARLRAGLPRGSSTSVCSIRGMAGIGKTQLAAEYAHAEATDYPIVFWISSEQPERLPDQFSALAAALQLGLPPETGREELISAVHGALRAAPGFLLIFDNAERPADIRPYLPVGVVPAGTAAHVVVTTRRSGFAALGPVVEIDVLDRHESVTLLRRRTPELGEDLAGEMADWLGDLPLALEQASAYLERTGLPAGEYLRLLRTRGPDLHRRGRVSDRRDTIATMWDVTLEGLAGESPAAVQLLEICAHLAPEPIPLSLFTERTDLLPEPLAAAAADEVAFVDTVGALVHLSLARRTPAGLVMHRLVQAVIRDRARADARRHDQPGAAPPAAQPSAPAAVAVDLLRHRLPADIIGRPENWPVWHDLISHVLTVTNHAVPQQSARSAAWLLNRAATYLLLVRARPSESRPLFERALAIDEQQDGADPAAVASDLNDVAMVLQDLGDPRSALPLVERALTIDRALLGTHHPNVARDLNNLALILQDLGDPQGARPLVEEVLAIDRWFFDADDPTIAVDLNNLAMVLQDLGEVDAAIPLLEQARDIQLKAVGARHTHVAIQQNNLATAWQRLGRPDAAKPLLEQAIDVFEGQFGPQHGDLAICLGNLAVVLRDLGEPQEAAELLARAVVIHESTHGDRHPEAAVRLNNLGLVALDVGDVPRARELLERALSVDESLKGPDHPSVSMTLQNLASVLVTAGERTAARAALARALRITSSAYGAEHPDVAMIRRALAEFHSAEDPPER